MKLSLIVYNKRLWIIDYNTWTASGVFRGRACASAFSRP